MPGHLSLNPGSIRPSQLVRAARVRVVSLLVVAAVWAGVADRAEARDAATRTHESGPLTSAVRALKWRQMPAHGILLKDMKSGQTLYEFRAHERLSPASLTKIMSAMIILESANLQDEVVVSERAARAHRTRLRIKPGAIFKLEDLIKAMLIVSANDACLAAIEHVGGDEAHFVEMMNAKAAALGLRETHFGNGCGFDRPDHYSTAEDLAVLSETALQNPVFRTLVRQERDLISPLNGNRVYLLRNTNRLLGRMPGVEGVKTGFTSKAGRCLIAKVSQEGHEVLLVLLGARRRWTTASSLLDYGLKLVEFTTPKNMGAGPAAVAE